MVAMEGKVAVVTGATERIGKAVAKGLAREGASVVLGYRSEEKAGAARREILIETDNGAGGREIGSWLDEVGGIVRRRVRLPARPAGRSGQQRRLVWQCGQLTDDGYDVMHLGYFLLTNLLLERCNGRYFSYRMVARSRPDTPSKGSSLAEDEGLRRRLWRASEEACNLPLTDSQSERPLVRERRSV